MFSFYLLMAPAVCHIAIASHCASSWVDTCQLVRIVTVQFPSNDTHQVFRKQPFLSHSLSAPWQHLHANYCNLSACAVCMTCLVCPESSWCVLHCTFQFSSPNKPTLSATQIESKKLAGEKCITQKFFYVKSKTELDTILMLDFL